MWNQIYPLAVLALIIIGALAGTACLIWHFSADTVNPDLIKRSSKGRRRSDR